MTWTWSNTRYESRRIDKPKRKKSPLRALRRPLLLGTGWLCIGLGIIGIILPLLPTTPFLLVAVWAFSRSSPEMADRIRSHRIAGKYVRDWEDEGVIPPGAKALATGMMAVMFTYMALGTPAPVWAIIAAGVVMAGVAAFILSRPSRRQANETVELPEISD